MKATARDASSCDTPTRKAWDGLGVYGLQILGLPKASQYLVPQTADAPTLEVRVHAVNRKSPEPVLTRDHAVLELSDGGSTAVLERGSGVVEVFVERPYADEALLHPLLSGSFVVTNWWHGRDAFHAGAFVSAEAAWVVLGDKSQGKSTTLGYLATRDVPVLSDDVVVVDHGAVLAGPAFIDLRPDAARALGVGRDLGRVGARQRSRLDTGSLAPSVPLAGWIELAWGEELRLDPVPLADRLRVLFRNRAVLLDPARPADFVGHAARPFFRLQRPRCWKVLPDVAALLDRSLPAAASARGQL